MGYTPNPIRSTILQKTADAAVMGGIELKVRREMLQKSYTQNPPNPRT